MSYRISRARRIAAAAITATVVMAGALASANPVSANPVAGEPLTSGYGNLLASAITANNVSTHLRALQSIANRSGGNRALGTPGYLRSVNYVEDTLRGAGYAPVRQEFTATEFTTKSHRLSAAGGAPITSEVLGYSGATAQFSAPVSQVPASDADAGCQLTDFPAGTRGSVVVISRGVCPFSQKADNAKRSGARAVVIVNNVTGPLQGTLGEDVTNPLPVVGVTQNLGAQVRAASSLTVAVDATTKRVTTWNVLAETRTGLPDSVVMVGAHLDSVPEGPGVNDNGSGTAGVLQTALTMTAFAPVKNKVRFAFWGAEEEGLIGSTHYVESLSSSQRKAIKQYLNFDMIGSHNGGYFVYDGDGSAKLKGAYAGPAGSGEIERVLFGYLAGKGLRPEVSGFDGRSDYDAFALAGIASGGADSGADATKSKAQVAKWGGVAGQIFDQNYHTARDTFGNVNQKILGNLAPAVAYATGYFAMR